jgi:splicing factor 3B subunit 3
LRPLYFRVLNRKKQVCLDNQTPESSSPILGSPIESTRSHSIVFDACALDVGYGSPRFASLERIFAPPRDACEPPFDPDSAPKTLVFYELDLGINSLIRCSEFSVPASANCLVSLPGPLFGHAGGVLSCARGHVQHFPHTGEPIPFPIPLRKNAEELPIIVASATFCGAAIWFALLQNQFGDLLIVQPSDSGVIDVRYFDTVPLASKLVVLRQGILGVFAETGSHFFYGITGVECDPVFEYEESKTLTHLYVIAEHPTLARLTKMVAVRSQYGGKADTLLSIHGNGTRSSIKLTRRGIRTSEFHRTSIGGTPAFIKSVPLKPTDEFDRFLILSSAANTRVFEIVEGGVTEARTSTFRLDCRTLDVASRHLFG